MNPPYSITPAILDEVSQIERLLGQAEGLQQPKPQPQLRKSNKVRTIQASLAIEGNTLNLDQVTALMEGKKVLGPKDEIQAVLNAIQVYEQIHSFQPHFSQDLRKAHRLMMKGLLPTAGRWRGGSVGILKGTALAHVAPPAERVPGLIQELFDFLKTEGTHPLIQSCVFHYELEFIHPFADGNGRIGRFWQSRLLLHYHPTFAYIPVESLTKENQTDYYRALETSDRNGQSTAFVEFSLRMIRQALANFLDALVPKPLSAKDRLERAKQHFGTRQFSRKNYLTYFKTLSTATASRDLKLGVDKGLLRKQGEKANTRYGFLETC